MGMLFVATFCGVASNPSVSTAQSRRGQIARTAQQLATEAESSRAVDQVTSRQIQQELDEVEKATDLDEETRGEIQKHYLSALQFLAQADSDRSNSAQFQKDIEDAPRVQEKIQRDLEAATNQPNLDFGNGTTQEQLEEGLRQRRALLQKLEKEVQELVEEPANRQKRLLDIPFVENEAQERLVEIERQLEVRSTAADDAMLSLSWQYQLKAERQSIDQKLARIQLEQAAYQATSDIPSKLAELKNRKIAKTSAEIREIQLQIAKKQKDEIDRIVAQTESVAEQISPRLHAAAQENTDRAKTLEKRTQRLAKLQSLLESAKVESRKVETEFNRMRSRVEIVGLSDRLGEMLRRTRSELNSRKPGIEGHDFAEELVKAQLDKFGWEDERSALKDRQSFARQILVDAGETEIDQHMETAVNLVSARDGLLQKLVAIETDLSLELLNLKQTLGDYTETTLEYEAFLDERILWFRSEPMLGLSDVKEVVSAGQWFTKTENLDQLGRSFTGAVTNHILSLATVGVGLLGLLLIRFRSGGELHRLGELAAKRGCRDYGVSIAAFLQTAGRAGLVPVIVIVLGWILSLEGTPGSFTSCIAHGLTVTGWVMLPFEFLRGACRVNGLAASHFDWSEGFRKTARTNLLWLVAIGAPLMFVAVSIEGSNGEPSKRLARLAVIGLIISAMIVGWRVYQIFRPGGAAWVDNLAGLRASIHRLRSVAVLAILIGLALLLLFAVLGFYDSVYKIGSSILQTVILLVAAVIVFAMAMRFLLVRRRRLRFEQLIQQRRAAIQAAELQAQTDKVNIASEALEIDLQNEAGMDITDVSRQARELTCVVFLIVITVVLLAIWQYLLPATRILDSVELWRVKIDSKTEFVTARDLLLSLITFGLTFFSVRNIPGMLELLLLQRLPLDAGARYAVASIFRYVLLVIGLIVALSFLKIPWSNYSWLVAAVSVGLGFGLQEIVANFVSGLILLLERPVRIGDVVTVDGVTGVVSRIQMRATTITNWDNQELVVPNKDMISGKLLNWTLSSVINRINLKFGVAYGTDVGKVRELVTKIVERHPDVLKEPKPLVTFEEFGDSSLNFMIRCCTTTIQRRWHLVDEINSAVNEAFKRENIEVPFPQRVVHVAQDDAAAVLPESSDTETAEES